MKKALFKLSVILVILPATFGKPDKVGCNKAKQTSDKETEIKKKESEKNEDESKINEDIDCTLKLT